MSLESLDRSLESCLTRGCLMNPNSLLRTDYPIFAAFDRRSFGIKRDYKFFTPT